VFCGVLELDLTGGNVPALTLPCASQARRRGRPLVPLHAGPIVVAFGAQIRCTSMVVILKAMRPLFSYNRLLPWCGTWAKSGRSVLDEMGAL
jgi:hypothetical protein